MKRNFEGNAIASLRDVIIWAPNLAPGIDMAGCTDDNSVPESNLLSQLSDIEQNNVGALSDPVERRHLIFRRCFQRLFLAQVLDWQGHIGDLRIEHSVDSPPSLPDAPASYFSFSSSGATVLACATFQRFVGVDIENIRYIQDPIGLSNRFFTATEAATIGQLPENEQNLAFLHYWTAKEAGLKAVGKGID